MGPDPSICTRGLTASSRSEPATRTSRSESGRRSRARAPLRRRGVARGAGYVDIEDAQTEREHPDREQKVVLPFPPHHSPPTSGVRQDRCPPLGYRQRRPDAGERGGYSMANPKASGVSYRRVASGLAKLTRGPAGACRPGTWLPPSGRPLPTRSCKQHGNPARRAHGTSGGTAKRCGACDRTWTRRASAPSRSGRRISPR